MCSSLDSPLPLWNLKGPACFVHLQGRSFHAFEVIIKCLDLSCLMFWPLFDIPGAMSW